MGLFGTKLEIIKRPGYKKRETLEYNTMIVGEIDLLCQDKISKEYYVIEIKRDKADGETFGQILQYMGWVYREFRKKTQPQIS